MIFEYVVSAISYSGSNIWLSKDELVQQSLSESIKKLNNLFPQQRFSILYNAFVEANLGDFISKSLSGYKYLMADSGGLQIITRGKKITKELKDQVYKNQAKNSDVSFCFDEIPLFTKNLSYGQSTRTNINGKYLVKEFIKPKAKETAQNIKRQIQIFDEMNSKSKIMLICQGQDFDTYREYTETIVNELTDYEISRIYGLAPSSACNGFGVLSRLDMLYSIKVLEIPEKLKKNIHLLGVGNYSTLLPLILNPNYFNFIKNLSYDSTSHSSKYIFGNYVNDNNQTINLGKCRNSLNYKIYQNIFEKYKKYFELFEINDFEYFFENYTQYSSKNKNKKAIFYKNENDRIIATLFIAFFMFDIIQNFMTFLNKIIENPEQIFNKKNKYLFFTKGIKSPQEYLKWREEYKRFFYNKKIPIIQNLNSLNNKIEDWF